MYQSNLTGGSSNGKNRPKKMTSRGAIIGSGSGARNQSPGNNPHMTNNFIGGGAQQASFNAPQFLGQTANYNPLGGGGGLVINGSIFSNANNAFAQNNFMQPQHQGPRGVSPYSGTR